MQLLALVSLLAPLLASPPSPAIALSAGQVSFAPGTPVKIVTVENRGDAPVTLRLTSWGWEQTAPGETLLGPTRGLVVLPAELALDPGESRPVRLLTAVAPRTREAAFQVTLEELVPDGERAAATLPVFVRPPTGEPLPAVTSPLLCYRTASFTLSNAGTVHYRPTRLEVVGVAPSGERIFAVPLPRRDVLAGGAQAHTVDLPAETCQVAMVQVHVETPAGEIVVPLGQPSCS